MKYREVPPEVHPTHPYDPAFATHIGR